MPLTPAFTFKLTDQILEGTVCVGVFDGKRPTLTAATTGGKIFIFDPYAKDEDELLAPESTQKATNNKHVKYLNINKKITAVTAGRLGSDAFANRDILFVGTGTDVLAYDVDANRDVFFKDAPEGVTSLKTMGLGSTMGQHHGSTPNTILLVGGNCSLQGFDQSGEEVFWTVVGDVVRSIACFKNNQSDDSFTVCAIGADDGSIKVISISKQNHTVTDLFEIKETDAVNHLVPVSDGENNSNKTNTFAYATKDGSIGVYENKERLWREKRGGRKRCTCVISHDLSGDGNKELIFGYADGTLEVRSVSSGEVLFTDKFDAPLSAIVRFADGSEHTSGAESSYEHVDDLLACALTGEVRGYRTLGGGEKSKTLPPGSTGADANVTSTGRSYGFDGGDVEDTAEVDGGDAGVDNFQMKKKSKFAALFGLKGKKTDGGETVDELSNQAQKMSLKPGAAVSAEQLQQLNRKKQDLLTELRSYEKGKEALDRFDQGSTATSTQIPPNTAVYCELGIRDDATCGDLVVQTNNNCVIKGVILTSVNAAKLFPGKDESRYHKFDTPRRTQRVPICPPHDDPVDVDVKVFVSVSANSQTYHVFDVTFHIPPFWGWVPINMNHMRHEDIPIGSVTFAIPERPTKVSEWLDNTFRTNTKSFVPDDSSSVRCAFAVVRDGTRVIFEIDVENDSACVRADTMEHAGMFLESVCKALRIPSLQSEVDFPLEIEEFAETLKIVDERNAKRGALIAETAETSNVVKSLIIHAEDSRILRNLPATRTAYGDLFDMNRELMVEHGKRYENHSELLSALKSVNKMITKASKLRYGVDSQKVIKAMRKAVKENNTQKMFRIVRFGGDTE